MNILDTLHTLHIIEVACDDIEAEGFIEWLNAEGHTASLSWGTTTFIDGWSVDKSMIAKELETYFWDAYVMSAYADIETNLHTQDMTPAKALNRIIRDATHRGRTMDVD